MYNAATEELKYKYDIQLLNSKEFRYNRNIDESDVYITTHGEYVSDYDKVNIDLWHGFPLKGMAKMDKQESASDEHIIQHWVKKDMIMSYSALYNTAMNACNGANISQYRITGMPRNDALFSLESQHQLNVLFPGINANGRKVIFFMPTFRQSIMNPGKVEGEKRSSNLLGLSSLDKRRFSSFLEKNNLSFVVKLHPFEESFFAQELEDFKSPHIHVLNDRMLADSHLDLYDVLGAADILITDYSSVYIDYLLLDRPILFIPTDLEQYRESRGLLFEPYEFWAPGPKIATEEELEQAIIKSFTDPLYYSTERSTVRNLCHHYQDNQSSKRIWKLIDEYIEQNIELIYERREKFQQHKQMQQQVKQAIQGMIESQQLAQANEAIMQYLESNSADSDIFAMNGMLHIMNGSPEEAIQSFLKGHQHFPWDEDLLYNLGYVYEITGDYNNSRMYYHKALNQTSKSDLIELINSRLAEISS